MTLPSEADVRALHRQLAPSRAAFELVYTHCQIVWELAEQVLTDRRLELDGELVRVGSLLHDIGVYRLCSPDGELDHANYIQHGVLGHELLQELGFPEVICRFSSRHTGMGLTRSDVRTQGLPIPVADYLAETAEEELVMYADKFHSKTDPPTFVTADAYAASVRRFGADKVARFAVLRERYGEPALDRSALSRSVPGSGSLEDRAL